MYVKPLYALFLTGLLSQIFTLSSSPSATKSSLLFSFFVTNSSLSQESEQHQPTQQSVELTKLCLWTYGAVFFFSLAPKFSGSRRGSEYCRVFNPLYLWGLCSIWYQICISQMSFDCCFPPSLSRIRVHVCWCTLALNVYIHIYWLRLGFTVLMFMAVKKTSGWKGCFLFIVAPCRVSSTKNKQIPFWEQIKILCDALYHNDSVSCQQSRLVLIWPGLKDFLFICHRW